MNRAINSAELVQAMILSEARKRLQRPRFFWWHKYWQTEKYIKWMTYERMLLDVIVSEQRETKGRIYAVK